MDNITHSLVGLALARTGLNRVAPRATVVLILSANAPDVDIVAAWQGALRYLEVHRGYTHCIAALPLMAALSVLVTAGLFRQPLAWFRIFLLACIGVASHLVLDWTNTYGIRLLLPFSSRWFHLDLNFLYDFIIWLILGIAVAWPVFAGLVSREIGARSPQGRWSAIAGLCFCLIFDCGRLLLHHDVTEQLSSRLYGDAVPLTVAALPDAANPLHWKGIVETEKTFRILDVNPLGDLDSQPARVFFKKPFDWAITAARATEPFRYFAYFARFPVWSEETGGGGEKRIDLSDLRFGVPGAGAFHCVGVVRRPEQVLESTFTFGSGSALGRSLRLPPRILRDTQ